ncbi:MAG: hypothetical protein F6K22_21600 [Okeania sp. SIO2F4]|uniref:hypothetical protein n=1 Tax=Okeania sp. SIO2F4 TaxID=2607790 RepID=UPI001429D914|nr:hypothetical protein [Okeania sp. SIO2F4]NES05184.1 hypothetical protein [Okeania sp. SIO2F4]
MLSELTGVLDLLKILLLVILGVIFITEPNRKSLNPLGFLLFAIGSNFLIKNVYVRKIVDSTSIYSTYLTSVDTINLELFLTKGVNIAIISWILVVLIPEFRVRLLLKKKK